MASLLGHTAQKILAEQLLSHQPLLGGRSKTRLGLFALASFMGVVACGFFIAAAYLWLSAHFPPVTAFTYAGLTALAMATLALLAAYLYKLYRLKRMKAMKDLIAAQLQDAATYADNELSQPVRDNPMTAVVIASLAGFIAGERLL